AHPPGVFGANGGERRFAERHCAEFVDFQRGARRRPRDCGIRDCMAWRRLVLLSERAEFCGRDRGVADDEDSEDGNEASRRIAAEEFGARIPVCDERSADTIDAAVAERAEPLRIAILGLHAHLRAGYFEGERADAGIADEFRGSGRGAGGTAFRGTDALSRTGAVDWGDVDDLCDWLADFLGSEGLLVVRSGAVRCGFRGHFADGGNQYADPKSRAG